MTDRACPFLSKRIYQLDFTKGSKLVSADSYRLYSWLISKLPQEYGDYLHESAEKPISQYLYYEKSLEKYIWTVSILSNEFNSLIDGILADNINIELSDVSLKGVLISKKEFETQEEFIIGCKNNPVQRRLSLTIHTMLSFKQLGNYLLYPQERNIVSSLVSKWNMAFTNFPITDDDAIDALNRGIYIGGYSLRTGKFSIKGVGIPGCFGEILLCSKLAEPMFEIWNLLVKYSEFSGIGIKTTLGMGGVELK